MCELWGIIREINSGISHVRYQFFPPELLLHNLLQVWWLRPLLCYGEYLYDCKLKKFHEMLSTTLAHNQHDLWHITNMTSYIKTKILRQTKKV
jgi:hypothetical protein